MTTKEINSQTADQLIDKLKSLVEVKSVGKFYGKLANKESGVIGIKIKFDDLEMIIEQLEKKG